MSAQLISFQMPAFSRGLLLWQQCQSTSRLLRNSFIQARALSSSSILRATTKAKVSPKAMKAVLNKQLVTPSSGLKPDGYQSFAGILASKPHTTLLYQAPSHTGLFIACYGTSLFCLTYAGFTYLSYSVNTPPGLAWWVPIGFTGISLLMAIAGGWIIQTSRGIVRSITAIPRSLHVQAGKGPFPSDLQIEIELKKMFPIPSFIFPARKIYLQPSELKLPRKLNPPPQKSLTPAEIAHIKAYEEAERKKAWEYDQSHLMTSPFRHMSRGFYNAFRLMRTSLTREGFMKIEAKGEKVKLDISDGWALDGGRALDRLTTQKGV